MKKIILDIPITDIRPEFYDRLKKKYSIQIIENSTIVNLVVWRGFLPLIKLGHAWDIKQKKEYQYICELFGLTRLKKCLLNKYDVWLATNLFSLPTLITFIICKLRGKKFGVRVKEWFFKKHNFLGKLSSFTSKPLAKNCDFLIAHSIKSRNFIKNKVGVKDNNKIFYIPKPWEDYSEIKYSKTKLEKIRKKYKKKNKKNILFVGRFMEIKGIDLLINAVKDNKQIRLILVGNHNNSYGKYCKNLAEKQNIDVVFIGQVGKKKGSEDMIYYYMISDLLVLPNRYLPFEYEPLEIWGGVVSEALSLGIPVIVTTATGCADDLVKNRNTGKIIKQNSVIELDHTINDFLKNPKKWKEMAKNGPVVFKQNKFNTYRGYIRLFEAIKHDNI